MNASQTETQSLTQSRVFVQEMQALLDANLKMGLEADFAWESTAASLVGCVIELRSKVPSRRRLYDLKEAIERAQKDGVGLGRK